MKVKFILATLENGGLGKNNKLPWHLPEDLKFFKKMTKGKMVVMGYKTFMSLGKKPLPQRDNLILSTNRNIYKYDINDNGYRTVIDSFKNILDVMQKEDEVFVIGGEKTFILFEKYVDEVYHTLITNDELNKIECDSFYEPHKCLPVDKTTKIMETNDFIIYKYDIVG